MFIYLQINIVMKMIFNYLHLTEMTALLEF